ncbi:LuxR C-terminal-related transcriptional regulator [Anabaena sp. UHCC 0451]|uniref:LuxR C-terminal-related transcriptional regulator n=1 Tax=Anabaena sp. UHCC 0451 TaxID=2055235 RepID=UPI002B204A93|nr:tetratricopeptide repeat protein [Anabaena sp. UHCC 0451]MEA5576739.1 tetratricopeptide repeat protein [Anabaena sp. UHCC 0451]
MNQQEFDHIFEKLTDRRKTVLQKILAGETDGEIAAAMNIGEASVRKYIERICYEFGLNNEPADIRRYKRSDLVALFAKYKPELLTNPQSKFTKELVETGDEDNERITESILHLLSVNQPKSEDLKRLINRLTLNEQERKQIAKSFNQIGHKSYLNSDFTTAASYLELAVEFNPSYGSAHYNLGSAYEKLDNLEGAFYHYQIAIRYQNRAADAAVNNLARLQILQGNSADAVKMIEPILSRVKDNTVTVTLHKNLAWAYFQQNFYQSAKKHLLICLELENNYAPAYCLLAQVQAAQGDMEGAKESWRNFLKFYSDDQQVKTVRWKLPELEVWKLEAVRVLNSQAN